MYKILTQSCRFFSTLFSSAQLFSAQCFSAQSRPWRRLYRGATIALCFSALIIACTAKNETDLTTENPALTDASASANTTLTIWWDKGFVLEEDEALQQLIDQWETQTGNTVELSLYTTDDLPQKAQRALQAGDPPDLLMSHSAERSLNPALAWQGKLVDVSDVIEPAKDLYPPAILEAVNYYNNTAKKRSYYAVPISQATIHIFYWKDLIQQAGYREADIPKDWDGFWKFWPQVQAALPNSADQKIYGMGFSFSDKAGDAYYLFEQMMEAYDVQILSPEGKLLIDDPQAREGIIKSLDWYTQFYRQGNVPPDAKTWLNPDNNSNMLNRAIVMTPNTGLSIPATVREDTDAYNKIGILEFPRKPSGQPMRNLLSVKQVVLFADADHPQLAKEFLSYLIQPETIGAYLKASGGRNLPVMAPVWNDAFWTNPNDIHLKTAAQVLTGGNTRPFYTVYHPVYGVVMQENVWARAINRIVVENVSPEQAADEAIDRIKTIFEQWQ